MEDAAEAYLLSIENPAAVGNTFLLPTGVGTSLNELVKMILEITGSEAGIEYFPPRNGDIHRFVGTYRKVKETLGWCPKTQLLDGLKREFEWIRAELS
ncbi:MAG: hypothetical protein NZ953_04110 [Thaumarchaeota archaeon]|nr:hypothetical protein [Candidatus Calditenuaceae archaeon]